jgi:cyclophilin family peptidyl-prolyl cis-trans isomerase
MKKAIVCSLVLTFCLLSDFSKAQSEVTFYTNMGTFVVRTYDTYQPITTWNFLHLVNTKFYDSIIFHRVVAGFVIQGGDPLGTGYGGPGYTIPDEFDPNTHNVQKAVAMANAGPNTGGSQFFINLVNNSANLDGGFPVFGIVIANYSVVQAIENVPVDANNRPLTNVVMDSLRVTTAFAAGLNEYEKAFVDISLSPNPVSEESILSLTAKSSGTVLISIYDELGKTVYSDKKEVSNGINRIPFKEYASLPEGLYHLTVTDGVSLSRKKFVVSR